MQKQQISVICIVETVSSATIYTEWKEPGINNSVVTSVSGKKKI